MPLDQLTELSRRIPIQDSQEALKFCRALAAALNGTELSASNGAQQAHTPPQIAPELSVIVPVFNEEDNLLSLYDRLIKVLDQVTLSFEILFINDGSSDGSGIILQNFASRDSRVVVIDLARNFGQQTAYSAGLDYARGSAIIAMDADLQDPPEAIPEFVEQWRKGAQVAYGLRTHRKEGILLRLAYSAFYRLLKMVADVPIPIDAGDFCIMDRRVVDLLVAMPERNRFIRGIRSWVGFTQVGIPIERHAREGGLPKYTLGRLFSLALDGLVSFSIKPLRIITVFGLLISAFSVLLAIYYTLQRITIGLGPPGFATIVVLVSFLAGVQLITIGVIGEYVGRIFEESKRRPIYITKKVTRGQQSVNHAQSDR